VAMILAIPDYRDEPASKTVVTFDERPSGSPEALHSWFYPGDNYGFEFVYKKSEQQYAARSAEPEMAPATPAPPVQMVAVKLADVEPPVPVVVGEEEAVVVLAEATPVPTEDTGMDTMPATLPQTSGNFAMIPLLGIMLLSGGFAAIRFATKLS